MSKDSAVNTEVEVFLRNSPEYLPRIRRIAACLADSAGMTRAEAADAGLALSQACVNAICHGSASGSDDAFSIKFSVSSRDLVAEITWPNAQKACKAPADAKSLVFHSS